MGIPHKVVGIAEIDKYAIASYEAMFGETRNYGDISKIEKLDYADFWTYSFPCTDISVAGRQAGINKNTRSGLLYQVQRLLEIANSNNELPKYLMLENVKNLVGKKFKRQFDDWLKWLANIGYNTYWQVVNAKDYGIPQNRERVFAISIRKDIDNKTFEFPKPFDNGLRLKDLLEDDVDDRYYISQEKVDQLIKNLNNKIDILENKVQQVGNISEDGNWDNPQTGRIYSPDGCSPTLNTCGGGSHEPKIIVEHSKPQLIGGIGEINYGKQYRQGNRVYSSDAIAMALMSQPTGNTGSNSYLYEHNYRIRKLTPLECWRLMGFDDEDFFAAMVGARQSAIELLQKYPNHYSKRIMTEAERIQKISNSQLYKQAGNSIVVNVLCGLFAELFNVTYITENVQREREELCDLRKSI